MLLSAEAPNREEKSLTARVRAESQAGLTPVPTDSEVSVKERQLAQLKEEHELQRNFLYFFIVLALLVFALAFIIYYRYRLKTKTNQALKMEMELLKHRRLESIGILAGGIAHDFNNLLSVIIGNIQMAAIKVTGKSKATILEHLDRAETASNQATDLAQKFVTFSEGGWLIKGKVALPPLLQDTAELYPDLEECHCTFNFPDNLSPVCGDERQIKVVFLNLLLNAREAMQQKYKHVNVTGENVKMGKKNEYLLTPGNYVKVSVADNGCGIANDIKDKIFDPYFTTKRTVNKKGLGLGLTICYSIMKKHDGFISAYSVAGKGTTFDLYFPAMGEMETLPPVPPPPGDEPMARTA